MCIICKEPGGKLIEGQYKNYRKINTVNPKKYKDDSVLRGLYSKAASDDCVYNDTKSHLKCWVLKKRYLQQKDNLIESREIEDIRRKI